MHFQIQKWKNIREGIIDVGATIPNWSSSIMGVDAWKKSLC